MLNKILPKTGVEPWTSDIESNRSTNWATQPLPTYCFLIEGKQAKESPTSFDSDEGFFWVTSRVDFRDL